MFAQGLGRSSSGLARCNGRRAGCAPEVDHPAPARIGDPGARMFHSLARSSRHGVPSVLRNIQGHVARHDLQGAAQPITRDAGQIGTFFEQREQLAPLLVAPAARGGIFPIRDHRVHKPQRIGRSTGTSRPSETRGASGSCHAERGCPSARPTPPLEERTHVIKHLVSSAG